MCWSTVSGSEYSTWKVSVFVPTVTCDTSFLPGWISSVESRSADPPPPTATAAAGSGGGERTWRETLRAKLVPLMNEDAQVGAPVIGSPCHEYAVLAPPEAQPTVPPLGIIEFHRTHPPRIDALVTVFSSMVEYLIPQPALPGAAGCGVEVMVLFASAVTALPSVSLDQVRRFTSYVTLSGTPLPSSEPSCMRRAGVRSARTGSPTKVPTPTGGVVV